ncbi:bifunctional diguanylate cyclase/phosphodiesterase [Uliginosibacterium flavum]|uniref:EAL domain-containing protein n=1 Tax=Uliginosibacterium flavum TaxID=1396831 RepID=A0ABV2TIT6_9RHOO
MNAKASRYAPHGAQQLRAEAESFLRQTLSAEAEARSRDEVLHELHVHQIELEMQNEELRQAYTALEAARDRYVDLYEFAPAAYLTLTPSGMIESINLAGANLLGLERQKLIHRRFARFIADQDRDRWHLLTHRMLIEGGHEKRSMDLVLQRDDGSTINAHLDCLCRVGEDTSRVLRVTLTDVTPIHQAAVAARVAAIAFESQEGIFVTDSARRILRVNRAFTELTGYSADEVIGHTPSLLRSGRHGPEFYAALEACLQQSGTWQGEIWNRRKNGEIYLEWLMITAVKDEMGAITHYVATLNDITARKAAVAEIERLAFYDPLTQLPNRRLMRDRLEQALANTARRQCYGALMMIDLDHFKMLNDTQGHDVGDQLLVEVASRLQSCVRVGDTVARLGGDEFVVILENLDQGRDAIMQAEGVALKIMERLSEQAYLLDLTVPGGPVNQRSHRSSLSTGITLFGDVPVSVDELMKRADTAMYQAKAEGRNAVRFFDPRMQEAVMARAALEVDLRNGLAEKQFVLHYQPQVNADGRVIGAEALLRWQHPERGLVAPVELISLAEDVGLIVPLGQWVIETAFAQLAAWGAQPDRAHLNLAVNVSAHQFRSADFVSQVLAALEATGTNPHHIKLELTESSLIDSVEHVIGTMLALKELGIHFSLDDFGTGYSSLGLLKRLPIEELKIDRGFVRDILHDASDAAIARTVVALGESFGLSVIAEGVETVEQRDFLHGIGCREFQGNLFSKALALPEFEAFMTKQ